MAGTSVSVDSVVVLRNELKILREEMEAAWLDHSRLNYDWLARCISAVDRAEKTIQRSTDGEQRKLPTFKFDERSLLRCPGCKTPLKIVRQTGGMLNADQFDAIKAGDFYCDQCPGDRGKSGFRYFWKSELGITL